MFRIKICGITNVADAKCAVESGADAIGLNFYAGSPRCVSTNMASQIMGALPANMLRVGVFVNAEPGEICRLYDELGLSAVQLHGDEAAEVVGQLGGRPVVRAVRCPAGLGPAIEFLAASRQSGHTAQALLIDSHTPGEYGGTGRKTDWKQLADWRNELGAVAMILAGGLTPDNVAIAIHTVRPSGVDVASGVELQPGIKSRERIQQFVHAARSALAALDDR